jgi:hypothetical protein
MSGNNYQYKCNEGRNKKEHEVGSRKLFIFRRDIIPEGKDSFLMGSDTRPDSLCRRCADIFRTILSIVLIVMISGCSESEKNSDIEVKKITNSVFKEPIELQLKPLFTLDSTQIKNPIALKFDNKGSIYILEYKSVNIKIFSDKGIFINHFFSDPDSSIISYFNINNDTLLISYAKEKRLLKTHIDGTELKTIGLNDEMPNETAFLRNGNIIGAFRTNLVKKDDIFIGIELQLTDPGYKPIKTISSFFGSYFHGNIDPEIAIFPFAVERKGELIFIGAGSDRSHRIFVYDTNLELRSVIENKIDPVRFSKEEMLRWKKTSGMFKVPAHKINEKNLIEDMFYDGEGRLWVRRAIDTEIFGMNTAVFDLFDTGGKYQMSVKLKGADRMSRVRINNGIIYVTDPMGSSVTASNYMLKASETSE